MLLLSVLKITYKITADEQGAVRDDAACRKGHIIIPENIKLRGSRCNRLIAQVPDISSRHRVKADALFHYRGLF